MNVEIFTSNERFTIEDEINGWLESMSEDSEEFTVVSIQFSSTTTLPDTVLFSCLIYYEYQVDGKRIR
jgi:hypothetical protein